MNTSALDYDDTTDDIFDELERMQNQCRWDGYGLDENDIGYCHEG